MTAGGVVHNFQERLHYSERASDETFWDRVYRKAFPGMVNQMLGSGNTQSQRMGIDRVILLANGRTLTIDEKKRAKTWGDILLEYVSVDTTGAPGWIEKDLAIDFLAYAFMDTQRVYLFSWLLLRRAWERYKDQWLSKYKLVEAKNEGYITKSVAIPINVLQEAVQVAAVIDLEAIQPPDAEKEIHPAAAEEFARLPGARIAKRTTPCSLNCGRDIEAGVDYYMRHDNGDQHWAHELCVREYLATQETQPDF